MKLTKSLYGLKASPRRRFQTLTDAMTKAGMQTSKKDPCVMFLRDGDFHINSATHVDDIFMTTNDKTTFVKRFELIPIEFGPKV